MGHDEMIRICQGVPCRSHVKVAEKQWSVAHFSLHPFNLDVDYTTLSHTCIFSLCIQQTSCSWVQLSVLWYSKCCLSIPFLGVSWPLNPKDSEVFRLVHVVKGIRTLAHRHSTFIPLTLITMYLSFFVLFWTHYNKYLVTQILCLVIDD